MVSGYNFIIKATLKHDEYEDILGNKREFFVRDVVERDALIKEMLDDGIYKSISYRRLYGDRESEVERVVLSESERYCVRNPKSVFHGC